MPGLITHYICGEAALRGIANERRAVLEEGRTAYNVGTQGPDVFFYYYPGLLQKKISRLGNIMHEGKVPDFVNHLLKCIQSMQPEYKLLFTSYLCGYLTHYALDYNSHPYIYYSSGFRKKGEMKGLKLKYSVNHRNFETAIDVLILKLMSNEKPSDKKLWELIAISKAETQTLSQALSRTINKIYSVPITSLQVYKSMRLMALTTRLLQSKTGVKKHFVEFVENLTIGEHCISSLIHLQELKDGLDYLNLKKSCWNMPWDKNLIFNYSFTDMYNKSIADAVLMINAVFDYLDNKISKDELMYVIGNKSMTTGIDADQRVEFKYYDIIFNRKTS